jgi:hypothetical protein
MIAAVRRHEKTPKRSGHGSRAWLNRLSLVNAGRRSFETLGCAMNSISLLHSFFTASQHETLFAESIHPVPRKAISTLPIFAYSFALIGQPCVLFSNPYHRPEPTTYRTRPQSPTACPSRRASLAPRYPSGSRMTAWPPPWATVRAAALSEAGLERSSIFSWNRCGRETLEIVEAPAQLAVHLAVALGRPEERRELRSPDVTEHIDEE